MREEDEDEEQLAKQHLEDMWKAEALDKLVRHMMGDLACMGMPGALISDPSPVRDIAKYAYDLAEAVLRERKQRYGV